MMHSKLTRANISRKIAEKRPRRTGRSGAVGALRDSWSAYPQKWASASELNMGFKTLGEEWGGPDFADLVVNELAAPFLGPEVDVLELGCGGGKFSQRLSPRCKSLICADISPNMIKQAQSELAKHALDTNVTFKQLNGTDFSGIPDNSVDFIFSYDVQLHLQPQNVFSYMSDARRILRDNGVFMLHQIDLASPGGIEHFRVQYRADTWKLDFDHPNRLGHIYYMSEDQMRTLGELARLNIDRIVTGFPGEGLPLRHVTGGRDIVGFFKASPSRLNNVAVSELRLVRGDSDRVYLVLAGQRMAINSSVQFDSIGLAWDQIKQLPQSELEAIPESSALQPWE